MKIKREDKPLLLRHFESEMQRLYEETNGCDAAYIFGPPKDRWEPKHGEQITQIELAMRRPPSPWFWEFGRTVYPRIIHPTGLKEFRRRFSFFQAYADAIAEAWIEYRQGIEQQDAAFRTLCHAIAKKLPDVNQKLETWINLQQHGSECFST
jgi:hypothetical protein